MQWGVGSISMHRVVSNLWHRLENCKLLTALCLLICQLTSAQLFPVNVIPQIIPPYSLKLSDYQTTSSEKLIVNLLLTDTGEFGRQVRLKMSIEGQGLNIQTRDFVVGANPISLDGGVNQRLTNLDLRPYFRLNNLLGINPRQYNQPLPDGRYDFCFQVFDRFSGQVLSQKRCAFAYLVLNDPPFLNLPQRGEQIIARDPLNIVFRWTPRHLNAMGVRYEFTLKELWDTGIDPQAAFLASPILHQETTFAPTLLYGPANLPLLPDKTYGWRVRAISSTNGIDENAVYRNNGYSEIFHFRLTKDCKAPKFALSEVLGQDQVKIAWQGDAEHLKYKVQYRKVAYTQETDKQRQRREKRNKKRAERGKEAKPYTPKRVDYDWFEVNTRNQGVQIGNLEAGQTYEFRVGGSCNAPTVYHPYYTYSDVREFTIPLVDETSSYQCGVLPEIYISNKKPLQHIGVNEVFTASDFPVTVTQIRPSPLGGWEGAGFVVVPYLGDARIQVTFSNIQINTDYQLIDGVVQTAYDASWQNVVSGDGLVEDIQTLISDINDIIDELVQNDRLTQAEADAEYETLENLETQSEEALNALEQANQNLQNLEEEDATRKEIAQAEKAVAQQEESVASVKEALANKAKALQTIAEKGRLQEDAEGFFDGYLPISPVKNKDHIIASPDSKLRVMIPASDDKDAETKTFYEEHTANIAGTSYTFIFTSSASSKKYLKKAKAKIAQLDTDIGIYYHYDTENNRLGYKVEVNRSYFGNEVSNEDFEQSKNTFKQGIKNLIAELNAVEDWSAEIFEITVGLNHLVKSLLDAIVLPEQLWNPDHANYNDITFHIDALPAGLIDGALEEIKSLPLLMSLVVDYSTSAATRQKVKSILSDFDFTEALEEWYEERKDLYTNQPVYIIEHQTGKDVVGVATILTGAGAALKALKNGAAFIDGLVGQVKKKIGDAVSIFKVGDNILDFTVKQIRKGTNGKVAIIGRSMGNSKIKGVKDIHKELIKKGNKAEIFDASSLKGEWLERFQEAEKQFFTATNGFTKRLSNQELLQLDMYKLNKEWVNMLKKEGYTILDMGDFNNQGFSAFYAMEKNIIFR